MLRRNRNRHLLMKAMNKQGEFNNKILDILDKIKWGNIRIPDALDAINQAIAEHEAERMKDYPDTNADGYVFCGKCGKIKEGGEV